MVVGFCFFNMAYSFEVPESLAGQTLRQLASKYGFRSDVLAGFGGIGEDTPLSAGQTFNLPSEYGANSSEGGFASKYFSPVGTYATAQSEAERTAFNESLRTEEEDFLNRFRTEYPGVLTSLEEQLGLPQLRQSAYDLSSTLTNIPTVQEGATRGFDVTANQLARIISSEQGKIAPLAQEAVRLAQFGEEEFGRQAEIALKPYETEIDLMKDRFARESTGFNQDAENRLNLLLTQIQEEGATNRATLSEATKLAQLEQANEQYKQGITTVDLGDRIAILDVNGNEIGSFPKGTLSSGGGSAWD